MSQSLLTKTLFWESSCRHTGYKTLGDPNFCLPIFLRDNGDLPAADPELVPYPITIHLKASQDM